MLLPSSLINPPLLAGISAIIELVDQHKVVENDADITDYLVHCVVYNSIKDYIKLEDESSLFTSLKL